jgi:hypothetical protein
MDSINKLQQAYPQRYGTVNTKRFRILGIFLLIAGVVFVAVGGYAFLKTQEGYKSLNSFSAAQDVKLAYNDQGQLTSAGKTEEATAIMSLLKNDWGYPVVDSELNPNDPVVNTASEYMFQMATIAYHTLHSTQTVVLDANAVKGTDVAPGTYQFNVDGRYWAQFDRTDPIQAAARGQAWTGTAHALIAELGVGTATASALQLALALAGLFAALGATLFLTGAGIIWAVRPVREAVPAPVLRPASTIA